MDNDDIFKKFTFLNLNNQSQKNLFSLSNITQSQNDDEENEIIVLNDEKTELSQIKELDNDSRSVTEYAMKSRKESQLNLRESLNNNEEKKDDEFLRPHDIKLNNKNFENNFISSMNNNNNIKNNNININIINNNQFDFEDLVNKKYGLFPII